ncbi:hypothetical protein DL96DRAFT_1276882 [Flagelloscypha sp. PMI_526]|nr:hypothetical protein DL96DRAFT_1276882 [Flagelloscypha sp. PMI_526]
MQPQFWQSDVMNDVMFSTKDSIIPSHSEPTLSLDWNKFGLIQWIDLIKNNNLLNGVRMDQESGPTPGAYPLVRTPPRLEYFHTYRNTNALNNSHTTYSLRESKYIAHGWTPASLSSSSFFLSANDTSRLRTASENSVYEDIYTIAKYMYAFVTIVLDPMDMDPTEKFSNAIEAALKREDDAEKRKELESVFKKYGHSFQTEVTLGGQLVATEITKANVNVSKEQVAQELCAKLSGGIQAATSPHQSTPVSVPVYTGGVIRIETQQIVVKTKGGNPLLSNGLASWIPSLADYRNWRIIEVIDAVPVTEFIRDATMKAEVEKLIMPRGKPLRGRWVKPFEFNTNAEGGSGVAWFTNLSPRGW